MIGDESDGRYDRRARPTPRSITGCCNAERRHLCSNAHVITVAAPSAPASASYHGRRGIGINSVARRTTDTMPRQVGGTRAHNIENITPSAWHRHHRRGAIVGISRHLNATTDDRRHRSNICEAPASARWMRMFRNSNPQLMQVRIGRRWPPPIDTCACTSLADPVVSEANAIRPGVDANGRCH